MAAEATEEIRALAERLKRQTRHVLVIELCEKVLAWRPGLPAMAIATATVSGVVGAGGIGQELKNSIDLLDFARLFTIIAVILVVVTGLDQLSGWLRKRLV